MKKNLFIIAAALVLASCGGNHQKADDPLADSGRTQRMEIVQQVFLNSYSWNCWTTYSFDIHRKKTCFTHPTISN